MRCHTPGERDVSPRHLLQVVDGRRLPGEAVVGVVISHDGGGAQLAQLAVGTLQLQLDGLQLCVLAPVHWQGEGVTEGLIEGVVYFKNKYIIEKKDERTGSRTALQLLFLLSPLQLHYFVWKKLLRAFLPPSVCEILI